jgi:hypothetical protein
MDEQRGIKKKHKRSFGRESPWNPREYSNGNCGNKQHWHGTDWTS